MTVRQLLMNLDASELTEWMAFDSIETLGEARADLRAGIIAAAVANHGARDIQKPYRPIDFMPFQAKPEDETPMLVADKDKQSALILQLAFNKG
jgi:hypothetical protein